MERKFTLINVYLRKTDFGNIGQEIKQFYSNILTEIFNFNDSHSKHETKHLSD